MLALYYMPSVNMDAIMAFAEMFLYSTSVLISTYHVYCSNIFKE